MKPEPLQYSPWEKDGWKGQALADLAENMPDPAILCSMGESIVERPNRTVRRGTLQGKEVYIKCYRENSEQRPWWKRVFQRKKCFQVLEISRQLLAAGIGCPRTFLAADRQWEELTVLEGLEFPTISNLCWYMQREEQREEWKRLCRPVAQAIASLHRAGFIHGDCIPGNLCINQNQKVFFIDNDRTRRCFWFRKRQQMRNLIQFCAHLWVMGSPRDEEECRMFLHEYEEAAGVTGWVEKLIPLWKTRTAQIQQELKERFRDPNFC